MDGYFYSKIVFKISQGRAIGFYVDERLAGRYCASGAGKFMARSTKPAFHPIPYAAMSLIGVSTRQGFLRR